MCEQGTNGIVVGIVTQLEDDDHIGRVKVRYPTMEDQESHWARMATLMAGPGRGTYFLPDPDDEVLIAFEHNDPRRPYVLGGLWSRTDSPPQSDGDQARNNWRFIRSRSGHVIKLDDTSGGEKIELIDKDGRHTIAIDSAADSIRVVSDSGDVHVTATAGKVTVSATTVEMSATGDMTLSANGTLTIKGRTAVNINPPG
jgi:phage baseplate assembly protein V